MIYGGDNPEPSCAQRERGHAVPKTKELPNGKPLPEAAELGKPKIPRPPLEPAEEPAEELAEEPPFLLPTNGYLSANGTRQVFSRSSKKRSVGN